MARKKTAIQRFRENKKCSQLFYTPEQYALVKAAAAIDHRPMTQFAIIATLRAARLVLDGGLTFPDQPRDRKG